MRCSLLLGIALSTALMAASASAGYVVSATESSKLDIDGINYGYTIILTNASTSTSQVGTFWFSWVPGKDFMSNSPTAVSSPPG